MFSHFYSNFLHTHCSPSPFGEPNSLSLQITERSILHTKESSLVHMPSNRLEVTVHRAFHGEYPHPMSQTNHYGSYLSSDAQLTDKPHELGLGDNVEARDEKKKKLGLRIQC